MQGTSYFRIPAVIFAVLVGGLFVYAKSGGRFFTPGKPTPTVDSGENDPSLPRIEFMLGPKSAPAFVPEESAPVQVEVQPVSGGKLLPGSKSAILVSPESLVPAGTPNTPANENPQPAETPQPTSPRLLPGSKSLILVDPNTLKPQQSYQQPAPPTNVAPPTNNAPTNTERPRSLLPGSKSRAVIDPDSFVPQKQQALQQPVPNQIQQARPQPAPQQQQRTRTRNYAPQGVER
jgi:hypothetical protein